MRKHPLCVSFLLASALLLACDGSKKPLPTGSSATPTDFCNSFMQAAEDWGTRCLGGTPAFWTNVYSQVLDCNRLAQTISSGDLSYDANSGAQCLSQIAGYNCDQTGEVPACTAALVGHVSSGGACSAQWLTVFSVCAPGNYCHFVSNTCGGTCRPYAQPGSSCAYSSTDGSVDCARGSNCQLNTQVCVTDVAEGQPCEGPTAGGCADGLFCDGGDTSTAGTCRKRNTSGACKDSSECASNYVCTGDANANTCRKMKVPGDSCTPGLRECLSLFSWCNSDGKCTEGRARENETCGQVNDEYVQCDTDLHCAYTGNAQSGTCQKGLPAGSPCSYGSECAGSYAYCDSTTKLCVSCS
jgi:hypothetical protein